VLTGGGGGSAASEVMRIDSSGNMGVGTSAPSYKIHARGTDSVAASIRAEATDVDSDAFFVADNDASAWSMGIDGDNSNVWVLSNTFGLGTPRVTVTTDGNLGVGTSSPASLIDARDSSGTTPQIRWGRDGGVNSSLFCDQFGTTILSADTGNAGSSSSLQFHVDGDEKLRVDSDGDLLIGTTDSTVYDNSTASSASNGHNLRADGKADHARYTTSSSAAVMGLNRVGSDGSMLELRRDGSIVGAIGTISQNSGQDFFIGLENGSLDCGIGFGDSAGTGRAYYPSRSDGTGVDNTLDIGTSTYRYDDIYATNGTIQTSDRNEKQDIEELSDAEQRVAVACKGLLRKFRWKSSVEESGDDARIHFGIIAQDLQAAFEAEGLDAGRYAMFINTIWTDEETGEERSRMGVRYSELLAFIIAAI